MPTYRERIRAEIASRLTGLVHMQAGEAPHEWRRPVAQVTRPTVTVWLSSDSAESRFDGGYLHSVDIAVEIVAVPESGSDVITVAEEMAADVETRMAQPFELIDPVWESTTFQQEHEGDQPMVTASLEFSMQFSAESGTSPSDPAGG